jgi:hypothetical protein
MSKDHVRIELATLASLLTQPVNPNLWGKFRDRSIDPTSSRYKSRKLFNHFRVGYSLRGQKARLQSGGISQFLEVVPCGFSVRSEIWRIPLS